MKKMRIVDIAIMLLFIAALIVIYFFWGCSLDLIVTIIAVVIIAVAGYVAYAQNKKLKKLEADEKNK